MSNTERVKNIDDLNSRISLYISEGYKVLHRDNYGATLAKNSINWLVLIILLILFWPGAILYLFLYITGNVGKKRSVFIKLINNDENSNNNNNNNISIKNKKRKIPIVYKENSLKSESINSEFSKNISSFKVYEKQINELKNLYETKEKIARELIEKRFSPPQITYDRFIDVIDSCSIIFYNQVESTLSIINISIEHTPKIDEEIKKRIDRLKSILEKVDELTYELAINLDNSTKQSSDEVKDLLYDMQELVDSVKEYD